MLSVIVCSYNSGRFLKRALKSLFEDSETDGSWECVLINDGSTDTTEEICSEFLKRDNFRYFSNEKNMGLSYSCNRGLGEARGESFIRVDADDTLAPGALRKFIDLSDAGCVDFVYTDRLEISPHGVEKRISLAGFDVFKLIACGTLMRTDTVRRVGGYEKVLWEEYDLYLRYLEENSGSIKYIPEPLYNYYFHGENMTHDKSWHVKAWNELVHKWGVEHLSKYGELPDIVTHKGAEKVE